MNNEEFDELINKIPKVESDNPISTMNSINVEDLRNAVERFKKIPTYQDLLKENQKYKEAIDKAKSLNEEISHIIYEDFLEENVIGCKYLYERVKKQLDILKEVE